MAKDISVRLDDKTYAKVVQLARRDKRSVSGWMNFVAEAYADAFKEELEESPAQELAVATPAKRKVK